LVIGRADMSGRGTVEIGFAMTEVANGAVDL